MFLFKWHGYISLKLIMMCLINLLPFYNMVLTQFETKIKILRSDEMGNICTQVWNTSLLSMESIIRFMYQHPTAKLGGKMKESYSSWNDEGYDAWVICFEILMARGSCYRHISYKWLPTKNIKEQCLHEYLIMQYIYYKEE